MATLPSGQFTELGIRVAMSFLPEKKDMATRKIHFVRTGEDCVAMAPDQCLRHKEELHLELLL